MITSGPGLRVRRAVNWVFDHPWLWLIGVAAVAFVAWVLSTRSQPYHVEAEFSSAFNLVPGLPVDVAGQQVGMISGVHYVNNGAAGGAIVTIGISDHNYYPLHVGTTVQSRWGSTIGNGTRRLDLVPGPASAPVIRNNGIIQENDTTPAVDLDQVLNVLTAARRARLTHLTGELTGSFGGEASATHQALSQSPAAFAAANGLLSDMAVNTYALQGLILNGDQLTATLAQRSPAISQLISGAGQTFDEIGAHAEGLQQSLEYMPAALTEARGTLSQLDGSIGTLSTLVSDLRPGASELAPLAVSLRPTLSELHTLVPTGVATLQEATRAAPQIRTLLTDATPLVSTLRYDSTNLAPMVACIRPYAPEAGDAVESAGEWMQTYVRVAPNETPGVTYVGGPKDPTDPSMIDQHGVRAMPEVSAAADHASTAISTSAFVAAAGKDYALPRPPGLSVGQPWYLPQCGAGPNSTNPADDPENPNK